VTGGDSTERRNGKKNRGSGDNPTRGGRGYLVEDGKIGNIVSSRTLKAERERQSRSEWTNQEDREAG